MKLLTAIVPITWMIYTDHWYANWYVALPPGHPYHGVDYDDIPVDIHGGLTYWSMKNKDDEFRHTWEGFAHIPEWHWIVWFDTCHYGDDHTNWDKEAVEKEIQSLVEQLEALANRPVPQLQSVTSLPDPDRYDSDREEFGEYDIKPIAKAFPDMVGIYDYRTGLYSGDGYLIWLSQSKWYAIPLGHCSCNWPTEDCHRSIPYTKEDILKLVSGWGKYDATEEVKKEFIDFINNH